MPYQWTTNRQYTAPSAADGVSITPSGSAWTSSAWVELIASTSTDCLLTGIYARYPIDSVQFEVDIGVGAAAAEVVIATVKGFVGAFEANADPGGQGYVLPIAIDAIPSGSRVAARLRISTTSVTAWRVSMAYYQTPLAGELLTTENPIKVFPSAASLSHVTDTDATTVWVNGAWVQLSASLSTDIILAGVILIGGFNGFEFEVDFGTGAAASEVVQATFRGVLDGAGAVGPGVEMFVTPINRFASGSRLAARARGNGLSSGVQIGYLYYEAPL